MNRSDLSQYISGKVIPGQEKLSILGQALNVSETWLMGFDVPLEYETSPVKSNEFTLTDSEKRLISYYRMMNELGKEAAITRIKELTYIPNYMQHSVGPISEISSSTKENTLFAAHEIEGSSKEDKDFDYNIIINGTDW